MRDVEGKAGGGSPERGYVNVIALTIGTVVP